MRQGMSKKSSPPAFSASFLARSSLVVSIIEGGEAIMIGDIFPQEHNQVLQCKHRVARELIFSLQYGQTPLCAGKSLGGSKLARHDEHLFANLPAPKDSPDHKGVCPY